MESIIEILQNPATTSIIGAEITFILTNFYKKTIYYKIINILIDAFVEILEETELEVPAYIEKLIMKIHSVSDDTKEVENILEDKKAKKLK
jgi:hypothetical protein